MSIDPARLQAMHAGMFPSMLGVRFVEAAPGRVVAEMDVRDEHCTVPGVMHGGAIMAFADTLGATGTALNLPRGAGTTTIESKTNFFAAVRSGHVSAVSRPLHRGKRTIVVDTELYDDDGRLVARVTQTQAVL